MSLFTYQDDSDWNAWDKQPQQKIDDATRLLAEKCQRLEYIARAAILAAYSYRDDNRTREWLSAELEKFQRMLDGD